MEERRYSLREAQEILGISERTIHRWIKSGKLKSYKPGRDHQIPVSAIRKVLEESEVYPKVQSRLWPEEEPEPHLGLSWEAARSHARMGATMAAVWGPELDDRVEAGDLEWMMRVGTIVTDYGVVLNELLQNVTLPDKETTEEVAFMAMDLNAFFARVQEALPRVKEARDTEVRAKEKASR
jgi:excisionase family DNA binding protein